MRKSLLEHEVITDGSGAEQPRGLSWVDSLLANKVQTRFPHVARTSFHFPSRLLQPLPRAEFTLELLLSDEGRKQPLDCRELGGVMIQTGPEDLEDRGEDKKAHDPPQSIQPSSISFPAALGVGCNVLVTAGLGLRSSRSSRVVSLLGLASLARGGFLGGSGESSGMVLLEAVTWSHRLQQTLGR